MGHPDTVAAQTLTLSPNPLVFNLDGPQASGEHVTKSTTVTASDPTPDLHLLINTSNRINWLSAALGASSSIDVTVSNTSTMGPGNYTGTVQVFEDHSGATATLNVTLTIANSSTGLVAAPSTVTFLQPTPGAGATQTVFLQYNGGLVPATSATFTPTSGGVSFVDLTPNQNGSVTLTVNTAATVNGTYGGNLILTSNFGSVTVPVSLTIGTGSVLAVTPNPVEFSIQLGGTAPPQSVTITSNGQPVTVTSATATQSTAQPWLTPTVPSGANGIVNLAVNGTGLSNGVYTATVQAVTNKGAITFQVTLKVGVVATLQVNPTGLNFAYQLGTSFPATQTFSATSNGSAFNFVITPTSSPIGWLVVSPSGQQISTPSTISVSINPQGLAAGTYHGNIRLDTFGGSENSSVDVPVTLLVSNLPILIANPTALSFNAQLGVNPPAQSVSVASSSTLLVYNPSATVTSPVGGTWLKVPSLSGSTTGTVSVEVNTQGLPVGIYQGLVNFTSTGSGNGTISVPVTLTITAGATFTVTPSSLSFAYQRGHAAPLNRAVSVGLSSGSLSFNASATTSTGQGWLQVSPTIATAPTNIVVSVNVTGGTGVSILTPGTYTGTVTITATGSSAAQTIPVTLIVSDTALLTLNPLEVTFDANQGSGDILPTQSVAVSSTDGSAITYTVTPTTSSAGQNWLSVNQPTGPTNSNVIITASPGNLTAGTYKGTVAVTATVPANVANSPQSIGVTLNVKATAILTVAPLSLSFTQSGTGATPESRALTVTGAGGVINFTAVATTNTGGAWLSVNPSSATTPGNLTVTASGAGLAAGTYTGTIFISSPGAANTQTVNVTMNVTSAAAPVIVVNPTTLLPVTFQVGGSNPLPQAIAVSVQGGGNLTFNASAVVATGSGWLSVSPVTGTTPGSIQVTVTPGNLTVGTYTGTVSIAVAGAVTLNLPISLTVSPAAAPTPTVVAVQHGASFLFTSLSPGMNIVIRGSDMGPPTLTTYHIGANGLFDTTLAETQVLFDGVASPVYYTSSSQVSVYVPYSVTGKTSTQVVVKYKGVSSLPQTYRVVPSAPGIYTLNATSTGSGDGSGQGAILNQNFSINSVSNPETAGSFISIYATGEGQTSPDGVDGSVSPNRLPLPAPLLPVTVTIGGIPVPPADVTYAGEAPGAIAGLMQVNARIPATLPSGPQPVVVSVGGVPSQAGVIVNVKAR